MLKIGDDVHVNFLHISVIGIGMQFFGVSPIFIDAMLPKHLINKAKPDKNKCGNTHNLRGDTCFWSPLSGFVQHVGDNDDKKQIEEMR